MTTKIYRYTTIALLLLFTISCSDWLDISPNGENVDQSVVLRTESAFRNAVNGIYTELRESSLYGANMNLGAFEFMSQSFVTNSTFNANDFSNFDYGTPYAKEVIHEVWSNMYKVIYNTNNLLERFEEKSDVKFVAGSKECLIGELHALRAMMHFDLLRLFHPSYIENSSFAGIGYMDKTSTEPLPTSSQTIIDKIILDLDKAEALMVDNDPLRTGVDIDTESTLFGMDVESRPWKLNYYAVLALKARVYLYIGDLSNAALYAELIIEDSQNESKPLSSVWSTPDSKDRAFSTEHLFGLASSSRFGIREQSEIVFTEHQIPINQRITGWFLEQENITDIRKSSWFNGESMGLKFGVTSWVCSGSVAIVSQRIPMFKISEVYLIASEALAQTNFSKAKSYFAYYKLRRTGQEFSNLIDNSDKLLQMIEQEYQIDFLGEGQLFFYFKRKNRPVIDSHILGYTISMDNSKYSLPIPEGGMNE